MHIVLWILAGLLTVAFGIGAMSQLSMDKERYRSLAPSQHWVDDFDAGQVKVIGSVKLLCVPGLLLPGALGILPVLTPLAACGLMLLMAGAATTRFRRKEWAYMAGDVAFLSAFAFLAWGRFALVPF